MENSSSEIQEEWMKLEQFGIPEGEFVISSIVQNMEGTIIILDDEMCTIEVFFDGIPVLVSNAVANIRMRTWSEIQIKYHDKYIFRNAFLFEIRKSRLVEWLAEEGCGFYKKSTLRHYCLVTIEEVVDVISTFEPIIKVSYK